MLKYPCISLEPVETIGLTSVLLTYNFSTLNGYMLQRCKDMAVISKLIRTHLNELQQPGHHPKWTEVTDEILDADVEEWGKSECVSNYETLPFKEEMPNNREETPCTFDEYCLRYRQGTSLRQQCEFSRSH